MDIMIKGILSARSVVLASTSAGAAAAALLFAAVPATAQSTMMDDIVVTAQRREEKINDVPITIAAISGDALRAFGYVRLQDAFQQVPNVLYAESGGIPQFNIRGVQLNDFGDGNEAPVGYYVDEVYLGTMAARLTDMFDIERAELLKGPQGTLFGRNTTGGLVQWITRKPTADFNGYGSVQYGSYDQVAVEGAVGGPLTDKVRARAAFKYQRDDGWQKNVALPNSRFSAEDSISGRLQVAVDLTDDVEALFNVHGSRARGQSNAVVLMGLLDPVTRSRCSDDRARAGDCITALGARSTIGNPKRVTSDIPKLAQDIDTYGGFAKLTARLGDRTNLVSISAYEYTKRFYERDSDGSTAPLFYNYQGIAAKQFSQEVRLDGTRDGFKWIVGAFYFHDDKGDIYFAVPQAIAAAGSGLGLENDAAIKTDSGALFGQGDIDLTDRLSLTAGGRYTIEKKKLRISDDFDQPTFLNRESLSDRVFTYRGSVNYKPVQGTLLFASAAKGFKSGTFKTSFALPGEGIGAGRETVYSYEIGMKSDVIPRRLHINLSGFYNDYRNFQALSFSTRGGVPGSFLLNVGDARIYGLEADGNFILFPGFEGNLGVGLMRTRLKSDNPIYDGNRQARSPTLRGSGTLRYTPDIDVAKGRVTLQASGNYVGKHFLTPENESSLRQSAYFLLDSNISWTDADRRLNLSAFVTNLTDKVYSTGGYSQLQLGFNGLFVGRPRTWGVRAGYNF